MIKVYPCLVIKDTRTYTWYKQGTYKPYSDEDAVNLLAEVKKNIPPWVRVMRVQRDIPAPLIVAGVKKSNLRQTVHQKLKDQGLRCRCIRCREIGHRALTDNVRVNPDRLKLLTIQYEASEGTEHFISIEDSENDVLVGYLRLRMPSEKAHRAEIKTEAGLIIRELHIYGRLVPVGKHLNVAWQHKGYGGILLEEAERLSRERYSLKKILVISGLGTKEYYKRFGYDYDGVYMSKKLGEQG
jgi:elongator complex protein 3